MADTIDKAYVNTYERTVRHLAQQGDQRLRNWVMETGAQSGSKLGEDTGGHNWDRLAKCEAAAKSLRNSGRKSETADDDMTWSRRKSVPRVQDVGTTTEHEDPSAMIIDPNSAIAHSQGMAMGRAFDREIISAASRPAIDGVGDSVAYIAEQEINGGDSNTGVPFTFDLITEVSEKFMANDIDPAEPKVWVIGPKQARKMLQLTEATNADYSAVRPLQSKGYIDDFMGFTWVLSNLLEDSAAVPDGVASTTLAFTRKAIGFQVAQDIWSRVEESVDHSFMWRIYSAANFGAVRVEDEHLVKIQTLNSI